MAYYPLHVHSALGSIGDSTLQISAYVKRAKEIGLSSLALTDHGSLSAMFTFIEECTKADVKPVVGMEAYVVDDASTKDKNNNHLILLAKNDEGLKNLLRIHNTAQTSGYYYKPRTDERTLRMYGSNLIALSACVSGTIPSAVIAGDIDRCLQQISLYRDIFDDFYLEIQPGNFPEQAMVNDTLVYLANGYKIPFVVTNDIHYLSQDDATVHDYHVKLQRSKEKDPISKDNMVYPDTCFWFMTEEDIRKAFPRSDIITDEVISRGLKAAEQVMAKCQISASFSVQMPVIATDAKEQLTKLCYDRLGAVIQTKRWPQHYTDRLEHELAVISQKNFCNYFLIVHDYISWCKQNDVKIGPGRGSAAGSLVSYLLGMSAPDPVEHGLLFERFLDPERDAIPDC